MKPYSYLKQGLKAATVVVIIVLLFLTFGFTCSAEDWPQWRGPERDGISNETQWSSMWPADGPKQIWRISVGTGYSSVAVSNGRVYTMGNKDKTDTIYCLDANTGTEIWKHSYPCVGDAEGHPGPASTPTVDDESVYTLSREGHLLCLDANSGNLIWSRHIVDDFGARSPRWGFSSSPLVLDNMLIMDAGMALAVDKSDGKLIWKTRDYGDAWDIKDSGGGYSSPYSLNLNGSQLLSVFNASGLVILDPSSGRELMLHPWRTSYNINGATPIVSGNGIFISSGYNVGCALLEISESGLTTIWQNRNMRNHFASCVLWEEHLYGVDDNRLRCLDWKTGDVKWTQRGLGKGSLMLADGKLIIMGDKGDLAIAEASPDAYNELARARVLSGLCWTVPVLSGGKIYCRNHKGELLCLDVSN
jgi:outer membrane protein assembly factor BamB